MKIYNEIVIDMASGDVLSEDSFDYTGDVMLCGGSGGGGAGAGEIKYPTYIETFHGDILDVSGGGLVAGDVVDVGELIDRMQNTDNSPYFAVTAYDPDSDVSEMESRYNTYDALVSAFDEDTEWAALVDTAYNKYNDKVMSEDVIDKAVEEFDKRTQRPYAQSLNRFTGAMADINSVNSSAFVIGMALLEGDRQRSVKEYNAEQTLQFHNTKVQSVVQSASQLTNMFLQKLEVHRASTAMLQEIKRIKNVMKQEEEARNTELSQLDANWDLDVLVKGASIIAYPSGAGYVPNKPSKASSALGGALSGAAAGAALGPAGAAAGAVIGGIGGLLAG